MNATRKANGIALPAFNAAGIVRKKIAAVGVTTASEVMTAWRTSRLRSRSIGVPSASVALITPPVDRGPWQAGRKPALVILSRARSLLHQLRNRRLGLLRTHRRIAAVDGVVGPRHERRVVAAEEHHDLGDLLGIPDSAEQMERRGDGVRLLAVVARELDHHARPRPAGRHRDGADAVRGE